MIPVVINNINRLATLQILIWDLWKLGNKDITILDNNSTYPQLLGFYERLIADPIFGASIKVKMLGQNLGQLAIYNSGLINELKTHPWIAYTDSDIKLHTDTPKGFLDIMVQKAEKHGFTKCGLALRIDDLPNNDYANKNKEWEKKYWANQLEEDVYEADVDTTFSIINPNLPFSYKAIRIAGNLTATHKPWYVDFSNLSDEEKYYLENSDSFSTYKKCYNTYLYQKP